MLYSKEVERHHVMCSQLSPYPHRHDLQHTTMHHDDTGYEENVKRHHFMCSQLYHYVVAMLSKMLENIGLFAEYTSLL